MKFTPQQGLLTAEPESAAMMLCQRQETLVGGGAHVLKMWQDMK